MIEKRSNDKRLAYRKGRNRDLTGETDEKNVKKQQTDGGRTIEQDTHTHNRINMETPPEE